MGAVVTLGVFAGMVRVDRTARGPVMLQQGEWVDVPAPTAGRVVSVDVGLSEQVKAGQVLARLETASGATEVVAPMEALVGRVAVTKGAQMEAGQPVAALLNRRVLPSLHVLFTEDYRPELAPGMTLEFQMPDMPQPLEAVIEQVEGPEASLQFAKAQRRAGAYPDGAVLVRARVPSRTYERDGKKRVFIDGEWGRATVKLGTQRLLVSWFPRLRDALP
ncbi:MULTISPECIES: acetyl-CoA carboxylase biotin carboxyl carrier protein subunit [unclassified Corallococcus]|uniref:acetyl-CoA carboxylase biotin carboxyl carrier protein subunit n=1 Tax=unclassified Corallococcus TaxID=2685029 RepID=UPI0022A94987|nr:acetyl-CoA carboxylase biotin carboxyl carrier protein subunit [Corallococcus sp. NCRR]WAS89437.1 acetyl-CoA carboxylase biotin carboxyl carrier protein subunit [Corallococcus sp. NCRR]